MTASCREKMQALTFLAYSKLGSLYLVVYFSSPETYEAGRTCLIIPNMLWLHPEQLTTLNIACTGEFCQMPQHRSRDDTTIVVELPSPYAAHCFTKFSHKRGKKAC